MPSAASGPAQPAWVEAVVSFATNPYVIVLAAVVAVLASYLWFNRSPSGRRR